MSAAALSDAAVLASYKCMYELYDLAYQGTSTHAEYYLKTVDAMHAKRISNTIKGFANPGQWCYVNSTLQCLRHSPFVDALELCIIQYEAMNKPGTVAALKELLKTLKGTDEEYLQCKKELFTIKEYIRNTLNQPSIMKFWTSIRKTGQDGASEMVQFLQKVLEVELEVPAAWEVFKQAGAFLPQYDPSTKTFDHTITLGRISYTTEMPAEDAVALLEKQWCTLCPTAMLPFAALFHEEFIKTTERRLSLSDSWTLDNVSWSANPSNPETNLADYAPVTMFSTHNYLVPWDGPSDKNQKQTIKTDFPLTDLVNNPRGVDDGISDTGKERRQFYRTRNPEVLILRLKTLVPDGLEWGLNNTTRQMEIKKLKTRPYDHKLEFEDEMEVDVYKFNCKNHTIEKASQDTFQLIGIVLHSGTGDGGHYISLCRHSGDTWNIFNDKTVTPFPITKSNVCNSLENASLGFTPAVFFYRKIPII